MSQNRLKLLYLIFTSILFGSLFLAGTGFYWKEVADYGILLGTALVLISFNADRKFSLPPLFWLYMIFVGVLGYQVINSGNILFGPKYFSLYVGAGLIWLGVYMAGRVREFRRLSSDTRWFLLISGLIYALLAALYPLVARHGRTDTMSWALIVPFARDHHHVGVWWGLGIIAAYDLWRVKKLTLPSAVTLIIFAILVIVYSRVRAIGLGLLIAVSYYRYRLAEKIPKKWWLPILSGIAMIVILGIGKSWTSTMAYFWQSIVAVSKQPDGYGIGNYKSVSVAMVSLYGSALYITSFAHNLILELFVGMGYWAAIFVAWLAVITIQVITHKKSKPLYPSLFLLITAIMMIDVIYVLPIFVWTWAITLGISQWTEK